MGGVKINSITFAKKLKAMARFDILLTKLYFE